MKTGIIVFAFGSPSKISANVCLAKEALFLANSKGINNIFCQKDVEITNEINILSIGRVVTEQDNLPPSTLKIVESAHYWAQANDLKKIIIVAAKPHKRRCLRDVKKVFVGFEIESFNSMDNYVSSIWFNKDSTQRRTRSPLNWWLRELILLMLPFPIYKKVTN